MHKEASETASPSQVKGGGSIARKPSAIEIRFQGDPAEDKKANQGDEPGPAKKLRHAVDAALNGRRILLMLGPKLRNR